MNSNSLLKKIYKRLLNEGSGPSTDGLAAFVEKETLKDHRNLTIYSINGFATVMRRHKLENPDTDWDAEELLSQFIPHVKGYIEIQKSAALGHGRCYDSWEVRFAAGPKIGELLYGLGFALTDNGKLTSDRKKVSPGAFKRWQSENEKRKSTVQFDDVLDPKTKTEYDDCQVFYDERSQVLNRAYLEQGWERSTLDGMRKQHYRLKNYLLQKVLTPEGEPLLSEWDFDAVEINIPYFGSKFFNSVYR